MESGVCSSCVLAFAAGAQETVTGVGFAGYTYMQDITKARCDSPSIATGTEGRLIDQRDGKIYWVAKLKDGLCWMTQNLDYDGGGEIGSNFSNDAKARYYDPGEKYVCDSVGIANNCANGIGDLPERVDVSWTPTDDPAFVSSSSYTGTDGSTLCNKAAGSPFGDDSSASTTCRIYYTYYKGLVDHYKSGNYYNYNAATNGTGASVTTNNADASGSVCPDGWSLPVSGKNTNPGSFDALVRRASIGSALPAAPYYFVYSGYVNGNSLNVAGTHGRYWSSTVSSATVAFTLNFTDESISPAAANVNRYYGLPVRCVAR